MAIPRKGRRRITVDGKKYFWLAGRRRLHRDGDTDVAALSISLVIAPADEPGRLRTMFTGEFVRAFLWEDDRQSLSIRPGIVARVIRGALVAGWSPMTQRGETVIADGNAFLAEEQ